MFCLDKWEWVYVVIVDDTRQDGWVSRVSGAGWEWDSG